MGLTDFLCIGIQYKGMVYQMRQTNLSSLAYDQLLQVGEYTREGKEASRVIGRIAAVYWCVVTAVYVGWSLLTWKWHYTWILWPVAGILFGAVAEVVKMNRK